MIRNQWYVILESSEVQPGRPVRVTRLGEPLALWRNRAGRVVCMVDQCPHRGAALSGGKLVDDRCGLQCPFHGFAFDASGQCTRIPANGRNAPVPKAFHVATYPTHEERGFIWIWWGDSGAALPPVHFFDSIGPEMSYATIRDHWATHYSRAIENQLDVVHLPFVHHNTIGRGNRTLVDGPLVAWEQRTDDYNLLRFWVFNRTDDGTRPRRPDEIVQPGRTPSLQFLFPNLWHNWISPQVRIVAAFAPIDSENTMLYFRMYQSLVRAPGLKQALNRLGCVSNLIIERQDKRVVETQRPQRSYLRLSEKLIQGDGPIIAYRRRRQELIERAEAHAQTAPQPAGRAAAPAL